MSIMERLGVQVKVKFALIQIVNLLIMLINNYQQSNIDLVISNYWPLMKVTTFRKRLSLKVALIYMLNHHTMKNQRLIVGLCLKYTTDQLEDTTRVNLLIWVSLIIIDNLQLSIATTFRYFIKIPHLKDYKEKSQQIVECSWSKAVKI